LNSKVQIIQTSQFVQLVAVPLAQSTNTAFDIIIENEITLQNYCETLVNKVFSLDQSQFTDFINYQSNMVDDALVWLNKFEKLISNNEELFTSKCTFTRISKLINLIEQKRKEMQSSRIVEIKYKTPKRYINAESEDKIFSFYELKKQLQNCKNDNDKIILLTKEKFEYQQSNVEFINQKLPLFDEQCKKEIKQIYELGKLKSDFENCNNENQKKSLPFKKLKFNCNVNQFVDVFYQLHRELFSEGKPIIDGSINDMVAVIVNSFVDKDGNDISPQTVETILKPSRTDKRPKAHKKLDIDKLL
jgi:hypothetical protein